MRGKRDSLDQKQKNRNETAKQLPRSSGGYLDDESENS